MPIGPACRAKGMASRAGDMGPPSPHRHQRFRRWLLIPLIPHAIVGWLFLLSYVGMVVKVSASSDYLPAIFTVTEHREFSARRAISFAFLRGMIAGREEDYRPPNMLTLSDLQREYPVGTQIEVIYNPTATHTFVQGQTLRVLSPDGLAGAWRFILGYTAIFVVPWLFFVFLLYVCSPVLFRAVDPRFRTADEAPGQAPG